ncbi:hypothetical protein ABZ478_32125 [Streptomyces sp. NPDC005706]|uniref:hypothetical protein n=1 Tax=Streptomyces sp. NPDC005706 TaxID=3157169 RepID=UPI00340FC94E
MPALADPFIRYVVALEGDFADDTVRDLQDGWTFNPDRIPGTVALLYRLRQLGACDGALEAYWSALTSYTGERPYAAVELMQVLAHGADYFLPVEDDLSPITVLLSELEDDGDWTS